MTFLSDREDEHDAFQAALTFVDEYQSSSSSDCDDAAEHEVDQRAHLATAIQREDRLVPLVEWTASDDLFYSSPAVQCDTKTPTPRRQRSHPVFSKNPLPKKHGVKPVMTWDPNKARNERKQELIYLRNKVTELEAQLRNVKSKKKHPRSASSSSHHPIHPVVKARKQLLFTIPIAAGLSQAETVSLWKEIADRQCSERVNSERENIRLKLVLERQRKIAKNLQTLLNKSTVTREIDKCIRGRTEIRLVHLPSLGRSDVDIFNSLFAGMEHSYSDVDAVFAATGLVRSERTSMATKMRSDAASGRFMEVVATKVLPFDIHATGAAVWHHFVFAKERVPYRCYYYTTPKNVNATEDTIIENFNLRLYVKNTSAHFRVKQILRRYIEHDRIVIIWRAFFDPIEFSDEPLTGIQFLEKGYIVVKRPTTFTEDFSLMQSCYITTPLLTGDAMDDDNPRVGAITDFVLSATASNITASHQMIENALLAQSMGKLK